LLRAFPLHLGQGAGLLGDNSGTRRGGGDFMGAAYSGKTNLSRVGWPKIGG
jgi:hypothetical protein